METNDKPVLHDFYIVIYLLIRVDRYEWTVTTTFLNFYYYYVFLLTITRATNKIKSKYSKLLINKLS